MATTRAFFSMLPLSHTHLVCRPRTPSRTPLGAGCSVPYAGNLPPIGGAAHAADDAAGDAAGDAADDPADHISERATFINFATEPRCCSTSYQEAAETRSSMRKVAGSAPK
jgi:hypothetical protein